MKERVVEETFATIGGVFNFNFLESELGTLAALIGACLDLRLPGCWCSAHGQIVREKRTMGLSILLETHNY